MVVWLAVAIGWLYATGVYMMLRRSMVKLIIGLSLIAHGTNLLVFTMGGLPPARVPIIAEDEADVDPSAFADPLPQALILTAVVIGFGVLAYALVLFQRAYQAVETDDLDDLKATDR